MISPAFFGAESYDEIVDALRNGSMVESLVALIRLKPIDKDAFRVAELRMPNQYMLYENDIDVRFELNAKELERVVGLACKNHFTAGDFDGFQVVDQEGRSVTGSNGEVYSYHDAIKIMENTDTKTHLAPVLKDRADLLRHTGPVFDEFELLTSIANGQYERGQNFNESHEEIASHGLKIAEAMNAMGDDLMAEKAKNRKVQKLLDAGEDPVTISKTEYDDLFKHAATLKSILEFSEFNQEIRQILEAVEVPALNESGQFDPLTLLNGSGSD